MNPMLFSILEALRSQISLTKCWRLSNKICYRLFIKRIEVRTRLAVFTNQIIRQAGVLLSKQWLVNENPSCADQQKRLLVVTTGRGQGLKFFDVRTSILLITQSFRFVPMPFADERFAGSRRNSRVKISLASFPGFFVDRISTRGRN